MITRRIMIKAPTMPPIMAPISAVDTDGLSSSSLPAKLNRGKETRMAPTLTSVHRAGTGKHVTADEARVAGEQKTCILVELDGRDNGLGDDIAGII
jgi:hypothetical protein